MGISSTHVQGTQSGGTSRPETLKRLKHSIQDCWVGNGTT